jgi:signal transduction histidine kinase
LIDKVVFRPTAWFGIRASGQEILEIRASQAFIVIMTRRSQSKARPEDALRSVSRRLAAASHDLQQPVQAMGLLIEALRKRALPEDVIAIVDQLAKAHGATRAQVMAMLDLSRLDAGVVRSDPSALRADDILADLKATFRPIATNKGVLLSFVPCSAVVRSDPAWIGRILGNLIANAVNHSGTDRIVVGCRRRGRFMRFEVLDQGTGMDPVFLEAALGGAGEAAGLGLAIVAAASALLGHPLEGITEPGKGTRIAVSVPLAEGADDQTLNSA